ncbi:DUF2505 domain-containing protein [Mycobacterium sp. WMMD1722]|uniref:DUF2505 domain-containing protein n=1 Tax=Mycobacterium sp. WMMD1722 TaxID=3404117 RepID=UPI003BF4F1AF
MSRRREHTLGFDAPADEIHARFVSEEYWRALTEFYRDLNPRTELVHFAADEAGGADVALRQVLPREDLPPVARQAMPVDLVITRRQRFDPFDRETRRATGSFEAVMPRAPGRLGGDYDVADTPAGCRVRIRSTCKVSIPLIGGTLEDLILTNMAQMFDAERDFTAAWLAGRR